MDLADFKKGLGRWGTGVTIITATGGDGRRHGFTASSFSSLSLDPPLVLVCLARAASVFPFFRETPVFGVNILSREQAELSARFAKGGEGQFKGVKMWKGETGVPLFSGCLANLECRTTENFPGGDHLIMVGEVAQVYLGEGEPLIYYMGRYAHLVGQKNG